MCCFPKSGDLQVLGVIDEDYESGELAVQTFITYLKESNGLELLDSILTSDLYPPPFKIIYKADPIESIRKLLIIFESNGKKTHVIIASNLLAIVPTCDPPKPKTPGKRGHKRIN
ncbi:12488_t:CDS:2 [Entrophospora sp. SA101]